MAQFCHLSMVSIGGEMRWTDTGLMLCDYILFNYVIKVTAHVSLDLDREYINYSLNGDLCSSGTAQFTAH